MLNKKAQGISINMIIVAIVALVVLVVLLAIFTGKIGGFGKGAAACAGECMISCPDGFAPLPGNFSTDKKGQTCQGAVCCVGIGG